MSDSRRVRAQRRVLGFDFGSRRIGVAFGQEASGTARPLQTLRADSRATWDEIGTLIEAWAPDLFVVGLPLGAGGSPTPTTRSVQRFIRRLSGRYGLPVETVDERLSSHEAEGRVRNAREHRAAGGLDALSACVIVEDWLRQDGMQS